MVDKLMTTLAERYAMRPGGYIRIIRAGFRYGDNGAKVVIEFVDRDPEAKGKDPGPTGIETEADEQPAELSAPRFLPSVAIVGKEGCGLILGCPNLR